MFKDTPEGSTHHEKDSCIKCDVCHSHIPIVKEILKIFDKEYDAMKEFKQKVDNNNLTNIWTKKKDIYGIWDGLYADVL